MTGGLRTWTSRRHRPTKGGVDAARSKGRRPACRRLVVGLVAVVVLSPLTACTLYANNQFEVDTDGISLSGAPALLTVDSSVTAQMAYIYEYLCKADGSCAARAIGSANVPGQVPLPSIWGGNISYDEIWQVAQIEDLAGYVLYAAIADSHNVLLGGDVPCWRSKVEFVPKAWTIVDPSYVGLGSVTDGLVGLDSSTCWTGQPFSS